MSKIRSSKNAKAFTIGRSGFAKISAVEGVRLSKAMIDDFKDFDRRALAPSARRLEILRKYAT